MKKQAFKINQFGKYLYFAPFKASELVNLIKLQMIFYESLGFPVQRKKQSVIDWNRVMKTVDAFQRPIKEKKIRELMEYFEECSKGAPIPPFPGTLILVTEKTLDFEKGEINIPKVKELFVVLDGQHRFVALDNLIKKNKTKFDIEVPTIIMDNLTQSDMAALFVLINSKQTRISTSLYFELAPKMSNYIKLMGELKWIIPAHDYVKALALDSNSPLYQKIKITGEEKGWVTLAALGGEFETFFEEMAKKPSSWEWVKPYFSNFFIHYFKIIAEDIFPRAWNNANDYSIKTAISLRAFIRVLPVIVPKLHSEYGDYNPETIKKLIEKWKKYPSDEIFRTKGGWGKISATGSEDRIIFIKNELEKGLR